MAIGRSKCVTKAPHNKVVPHNVFMNRIRKSLYFGAETRPDDMEVSRPLAEYASELFSEPHKGHSLNRLNSVAAGSVHATPCSLIMALIYLDRLNVLDPGYVRRITPQELFIVSMMISTKFYAGHDEEIYLSDWAEDGNMTENRLKQLEIEFLCAIDWNIYISNEDFFNKLTNVEKIIAQREGLRRGWLTYTELIQMLPSFALVKFLLNNITIMAVSYAASVITIAGAFFLASQIPGHALHRKAATTAATDADTTVVREALALEETLNTEHEDATPTTVTIAIAEHNATCAALNVEAELLNLERQYRAEAVREAMRLRYNEITSATRLTQPDAVLDMAHNKKDSATAQQYAELVRNWLVFKDAYSVTVDAGMFHKQLNTHMLETALGQQKQQQQQHQYLPICYGADCAMDFGFGLRNCTSFALFWQLLAEQTSFVRLPFMWLKFM